jgi:DNA replication and repair protein RecF
MIDPAPPPREGGAVPALAVTRLVLARFRSYERAEIALDGRPVAIHGPNGAGKTNLIEAVSLLSPGRGLRRATAETLARNAAPGWRVAARLAAPDGPHDVVTDSDGAGRRVEIDGKAAPQSALGGVARILWLTPAMDRLWTEAASERRRFLDRLTLSLIPDHGDTALAYDKALRERNRLLRDQVRDARWFAALEAQMAEHGRRLTANRRAALDRLAAAQRADDDFPAAALALESEAPDDLAAALAASRPRDMAAGRSLVGPHRDDLGATYARKGVPAGLASTGEQKALLLSLTLANARAVAADFGAAPILLLDEVAAHLDADRRAALFARITELGAQAFLTGTGPELFAALGDRAQWLAVRDDGGASRIGERRPSPAVDRASHAWRSRCLIPTPTRSPSTSPAPARTSAGTAPAPAGSTAKTAPNAAAPARCPLRSAAPDRRPGRPAALHACKRL